MFSQRRQADKRYLGADWGHQPDLRPLQIDLPKTVSTLEVFSTSEA
jgi:hypothetical protein